MSNVVYLGHIPDGFVEKDMWEYFGQFGRLVKLKLFRSRKTGRSKGFAFIQFVDDDVAKIVASSMNNYLMFEKILKCHVVQKDKLHVKMFKNWRKNAQPKLLEAKNVKTFNVVKTDERISAIRRRLAVQIEKQNKKLAELGINYSFPVTWTDLKVEEVKEELDDDWANGTTEVVSEYSMIVDSSDDEIQMKTPEQAVKRTKVDDIDNSKKSEDKPSKKVQRKRKKSVKRVETQSNKKTAPERRYFKEKTTKKKKST